MSACTNTTRLSPPLILPMALQKTLEYHETASQRYHAWTLKRWLHDLNAKAWQIVCLDETWKDGWDCRRPYARSLAGTPAVETARSLYHGKRWGIIGATTFDGIIHKATLITQDQISLTPVFTDWFVNTLLPQLKEGQIVLMDNAPFHDFPTLTEACRLRGIWLLPVPPRRPKDNPIEVSAAQTECHRQPHAYAVRRSHAPPHFPTPQYVWKLMKDYLLEGDFEAFQLDPVRAIQDALERIPLEHIRSCFRHYTATAALREGAGNQPGAYALRPR